MKAYSTMVVTRPHWSVRCYLALIALSLLLLITFPDVALGASAVSSEVQIEGTLEIQVVDDFLGKRATINFLLHRAGSSQPIKLQLTRESVSRFRTGQRIRVRGVLSRDLMVVSQSPNSILLLSDSEAAVTTSGTAIAPGSFGRVVVIIVDITDGSGTTYALDASCDGTDLVIARNMFGSMAGGYNTDGCFKDASFGAFGFGGRDYPGSEFDVVRVAISEPAPSIAGVCLTGNWAIAAESAAISQGVDFGAYRYRVFVLPKEIGCTWAGVTSLGCGVFCRAFVRAYAGNGLQCGYPDAVTHELGHNIGLLHARTDADNDGESDCEYCDTSDAMGYAVNYWRTLNAPHKDFLGWLSDTRALDVSVGGTFRVSALELEDPSNAQAIKVHASSGKTYWVSYRAAIGYDADLVNRVSYFDGQPVLEKTQVHYADQWANSYLVASLGDGSSSIVEAGTLTVAQLSHDADSALVHVKLGDNCVRQPVPNGMTPTERAANKLPATRNFTLDLTNSDEQLCGTVSWPLSPLVPPGWTAELSNSVPVIDPGTTATVNLAVKAPVGTPQGYYQVGIQLAGDITRPAIDMKGTVIIDTTPPDVSIVEPASGASYAQNLTVSSSYNCSDVVSYVTDCVGPVASGDSFDTKTLGAKSFTVKATDRAGNVASKTASYTVVARNPEFSLAPASLSFGSQTVGVASAPKSVTFTNTGNVPISIASIALTGTHAAQFSYQANCASPIYIAANCSISVLFTPAGVGSKTAKLEVTVGSTKKSVALSGTGAGAASAFTLAPASLAFGNVTVGKTSAAKLVTISNTGSTGFDIKSITFTGTHRTQFKKSSSCPAILRAASSCTVSITFKPTSKGAKTASLKVTPVSGAAKTVALTGTGK